MKDLMGEIRTFSREPFLLETSLPGVFAAGDVRSGSVKRVVRAANMLPALLFAPLIVAAAPLWPF